MRFSHKEKGYTISVLSQRGKPIVNSKGFVILTGKGRYRSFNTIAADVLEEKFEAIA